MGSRPGFLNPIRNKKLDCKYYPNHEPVMRGLRERSGDSAEVLMITHKRANYLQRPLHPWESVFSGSASFRITPLCCELECKSFGLSCFGGARTAGSTGEPDAKNFHGGC